MKSLFKNILVLAVMLGTYTSYANAILEVEPTFNNVNKGNYITVTDFSGEVVYSGTVNYSGSLMRLYDFSQLKDGTYTVEVNKDFSIEINTVEVKNNEVIFLDNTKREIFKPVFRTQNDTVLISKLALDTNEMYVELYYGTELIYSENVKGTEILNRVYKLDATLDGDYTAIIKSNDRVFIENFRI